MEALAIAAVALVGLWCLVVLPAVWLSGTMSQEDERAGQRTEVGDQTAEDQDQAPAAAGGSRANQLLARERGVK